INIPEVLVHMRAQVIRHKQTAEGIKGKLDPEAVGMRLLSQIFRSPTRYEQAQRLARIGQIPFARRGVIERLPPPLNAWTTMRDLQAVPQQTFREWWRERQQHGPDAAPNTGADGVGDAGGVNVEVAEAVRNEP
ncbi:MAG TPA: lactate utilization protein LutB domain-containing protein, partial [Herpetosiphonaceae bacterium]|nr:lactate utilization protein LutB domain-containing protein [Herpetosiphonaceae bacterium]